jgi:hypothetical protein
VLRLQYKYKVDKISFVADRGLFNEANIKFTKGNRYYYIVGSRVENTSKYRYNKRF